MEEKDYRAVLISRPGTYLLVPEDQLTNHQGVGRQSIEIPLPAAPTFGLILKLFRIANGFTMEQLRDELKIAKTALVRWESGKSKPQSASIKKLVGCFGISFENQIQGLI